MLPCGDTAKVTESSAYSNRCSLLGEAAPSCYPPDCPCCDVSQTGSGWLSAADHEGRVEWVY